MTRTTRFAIAACLVGLGVTAGMTPYRAPSIGAVLSYEPGSAEEREIEKHADELFNRDQAITTAAKCAIFGFAVLAALMVVTSKIQRLETSTFLFAAAATGLAALLCAGGTGGGDTLAAIIMFGIVPAYVMFDSIYSSRFAWSPLRAASLPAAFGFLVYMIRSYEDPLQMAMVEAFLTGLGSVVVCAVARGARKSYRASMGAAADPTRCIAPNYRAALTWAVFLGLVFGPLAHHLFWYDLFSDLFSIPIREAIAVAAYLLIFPAYILLDSIVNAHTVRSPLRAMSLPLVLMLASLPALACQAVSLRALLLDEPVIIPAMVSVIYGAVSLTVVGITRAIQPNSPR